MFDDPRERIAALADQCVMCGLCLPHCPTYALDADEAESPRGRIRLARALADGTLDTADGVRAHLDHCLDCLQCERVCPSQVRYGELLDTARALIGPAPSRPDRLLGLLARPRLARPLLALARTLRAPRWLPALLAPFGRGRTASLRAALSLLTASPPSSGRATVTPNPADRATRTRVALFPGCVSAVEDRDALDAAERLLHAAGFAVKRLPERCCGAMDRHDGLRMAAERARGRVASDWHAADAPAIVLTVTPGCLGTLRDDLPDARVEDALGFVARHADALSFRALPQRVAVHVPCSQRNVAGNHEAVLALLRRVPGLDLQVLPEAPGCCGAAGSHALTFPDRAVRLRAIKLEQLTSTEAERLLSSNIGCRLHLAAGRPSLPNEHPLTLLARQLQPNTP